MNYKKYLMFSLYLCNLNNLNSEIINSQNTLESKKVLISQVVDHPALNETIRGILDELAKNGVRRENVRIESAQANVSLASQIASKFANQNPDIVIGVGTISAQSLSKYALEGKIKLIFSSVTDPISANLVKSLKKPENNTSGVSNFVEIEPQIKFFKQIQPNLRKIGILYNPGENNSVIIVNKLETICKQLNLELHKQSVNKTSDIPQSATKLASNVDCIFISNDNTCLCAFQSIIHATKKAKIPVYVSDLDSVKLGALAALGPNQYDIGIQTAKLALRVLRGEDINIIPIEFPDKTSSLINESVKNSLNIRTL